MASEDRPSHETTAPHVEHVLEDDRPSFLAEIGVTDVDSFLIFLRKRHTAILPVVGPRSYRETYRPLRTPIA